MSIARRRVLGLAAGWALTGSAPARGAVPPTQAGFTYSMLHNFVEPPMGRRAPRRPIYGVTLARDGWLYGVNGAFDDPDTAFRLATTGGRVEVLHRFPKTSTDGNWPNGQLVESPDGHFYGVSGDGGAFNNGLLFRMHPDGHVTALHDFAAAPADGHAPEGAPLLADDGWLYGTCSLGGDSGGRLGLADGIVYRLRPFGEYEVLYSFQGRHHHDGSAPIAPLVQGPDGWLYGVTREGGTAGYGTLYRIRPGGRYERLYSFDKNAIGWAPLVPLMRTADGQIYGVTSVSNGRGPGTIFSLDEAGQPVLVHTVERWLDGLRVSGQLTEAPDGFLYFPTAFGSTHDRGAVVRLDRASGLTTIAHAFGSGLDGGNPEGPLAVGADGSLYGTTYYSPDTRRGVGAGSVFRLTPL